MKFKSIVLFLLLSGFLSAGAQDSLMIRVDAPQLKDQKIALCSYFNGKVYKKDSLLLSGAGTGLFHRPQKLEEGLYMVYIDSFRYFDLFLADDQVFDLAIDTTDFVRKNKISGAEQTGLFAEYASFIHEKQKQRTQLLQEKRILQHEGQDGTETDQKIESVNREVQSFQDAFFSKYGTWWVGKFFQGLDPVQAPCPSPENENNAMENYRYLKNHFFDRIDLTDKRFWWTNYFPQKIDSYMKDYVEPVPDSLANAASRLVFAAMDDTTCFQLMLTKLFNNAVQSQIMGMENVWAKLTEEYYLKGRVNWADSAFLSNLKSEYTKIRFNRIGMQAQELALQDSVGNPVSLYETDQKYTLLCFYEPDCGHCKKEIPALFNDLYKKYRDRGLSVACVYLLTDQKEWQDFVRIHQLEGDRWYNLWDPERTSHFWQFYDTSTTPSFFLLDENKKIIAKKLNLATMDQLLNNLISAKTN